LNRVLLYSHFQHWSQELKGEIDRSKISPRLNHLLDVIYKIKRGEYLDLKKEKFSKYLEDNNGDGNSKLVL